MNLATGVRITLRQPVPPRVTVTQPQGHRIALVPVRGPQGPAGAAGGEGTVFPQPTPAGTWTIPHGLGRIPHGVTVYVAGELVDTDTHVDATYVVLNFASPTSGEAHIL